LAARKSIQHNNALYSNQFSASLQIAVECGVRWSKNNIVGYRLLLNSRPIHVGLVIVLISALTACTTPSPQSNWIQRFRYNNEEIHPIELGKFGYPYVPATIEGTRLLLPFDTGNMVGVSVSPEIFDRLGLTTDGTYIRRDAAGKIVSTLRMASSANVTILNRNLERVRIYEINHPSLPGLVGPTSIGGGHITFDYSSKRMALSTSTLPDTVPGFRSIPMIRSSRYPLLILVYGAIDSRNVLIELDTGKSRTVINPALTSELGLKRNPRGVSIENLRIGDLSFEVPSAKEVDQTGIDPTLEEPILLGMGSDLLSRFVWTVDYEKSVLWIPHSRK